LIDNDTWNICLTGFKASVKRTDLSNCLLYCVN